MRKKRIALLLVAVAYCIFAGLVFYPWLHRSASRTGASSAAAEFVQIYAVPSTEAT